MSVRAFDVMSLGKANIVNPERLGYQDSLDIIHDELHRTKRSFVKIGWYLKHIHKNEMYKEDGYANIYELASDKFNLSQPTATRFMQVCEQFSVGHDSPELDEKYIDFNMSQLFEMLPMEEKDIEQVTPDMKVADIRKFKKKCNEPSKDNENNDDNDIPGQTSIEKDFRKIMPDSKQDDSDDDVSSSNEIIDGEYREIEAGQDEIIATSQLEDINTHDPEEKVVSNDVPRKCITGWSRYGVCPCCGYGGVQCCSQCGESCNSRCGWIDEPYVPETEEPLFEDDLMAVKHILEQEKKTLDDFLEVGGLPEMTVFRQKTIVGALAAMVYDLENAGQEAEEPESEQPELPVMKNDSQRKAFIDSYQEWPVWIDTKVTGERYYRYDFRNGTSFVVKVYFHKCFDYKSSAKKWEDQFHDDWGTEEYYILVDGKHFKDCLTNKSAMVESLKHLQKKDR